MASPLESRWWRWTRSWWLLWSVASAGLLAWVGFLYIGLRSHRRAWLLASAAWAVWGAFVAVTATLVPATGGASVLGGLYLLGWVGSVVHSAWARRQWLLWRAAQPVWFMSEADQRRSRVSHCLPVGFVVPGVGVVDGHAPTGTGALSRVHRVRRWDDGTWVAGKLLGEPSPTGPTDQQHLRCLATVGTLLTLDHPAIARVHGVVPVSPPGDWLLVSEWVDGENLERFAYGEARFGGAELHAVGSQLISALEHLEQRGVVHRDIKPGNVMVGPGRQIKVVDFDLSRPGGRHTQIAGTPMYMPPDAPALGSLVDSTVDRYALGVLLYELAVGEHPYATEIYAGRHPGMRAEPRDPGVDCPGLPEGLRAFFAVAVAALDAQRFASAAQMAARWEAIRESVCAWSGAPLPAVEALVR